MESLPEHLLELIADRASLPDLIRLGCACKSVKPICGPLKFPNHLPWLIVPTATTINPKSFVFGEQEDVGFFSLCDGKVYKAQVPQLWNRRICGSFPGGWLMTVHHNSEIQLFNPFSAKSNVIPLPPLTTFPGVDLEEDTAAGELYYTIAGYEHRVDAKHMRKIYIQKVAMSSSHVTKGTVIMTIQGRESTLAFYTIGENQQAWSLATPPKQKEKMLNFQDVTYYRGNFYAVNNDGDVVVVLGVQAQKATSLYAHSIISRHPSYSGGVLYILESSGDLLVVLRSSIQDKELNPHQPPHKTVGFRVLKVKFGIPNQWEEVRSLGNRSLFLGFNQSFSVCAEDFSGCKPNCIYFTTTFVGAYFWPDVGGHDFGIFNLEDGTIQKFLYPSNTILVRPPPIWFTPHPYCN